MSTTFLQRLLRLKLQLNTELDRDVAAALGMSATAFNERKHRGSFPVDRLYAVAQQRPELGLDVAYILGDANTAAPTAQPADSAAAQLHAHTLNRIVPTMRSTGFTIQTASGLFVVPPGRDADQIADLLEHQQRLALIYAQCTAEPAVKLGLKPDLTKGAS